MKNRLLSYGISLIDTAGIIQPTHNTLESLGFEYDWSRRSASTIQEIIKAEMGNEEVLTILNRLIPQEIKLAKSGYRIRDANLGFRNKKITDEEGKKKTVLEPDPVEALWIKKMFQLRSERIFSDEKICHEINQMGFKTRLRSIHDSETGKIIKQVGGRKLTPGMLQIYIQRPVYCGVIIEKWTKNLPVKAQFDGLVSIDLFNIANRGKIKIYQDYNGEISVKYGVKKAKRQLKNPEYPYRHVVLCPHCRKPTKNGKFIMSVSYKLLFHRS